MGRSEWKALVNFDWEALTDKLTCEERSEESMMIWGQAFQREGLIQGPETELCSASSRNNAEAIVIEVEYKGESVSGIFGQSRDQVDQGLLVTSVASTWGGMGASGGMEYKSDLIWLLLFFVCLFSIIRITC